MSTVEWGNPPPSKGGRAEEVMKELKTQPGRWAKIHSSQGMELLPWWAKIHNHPDFETEFVRKGTSIFVQDIYARFNPKPHDRP